MLTKRKRVIVVFKRFLIVVALFFSGVDKLCASASASADDSFALEVLRPGRGVIGSNYRWPPDFGLSRKDSAHS